MEKTNLPKEYQDLIDSTGRTLEELLGAAAEAFIKCDNCAIRRECDELFGKGLPCADIWAGYLMGVDGK